VNIWLISFYIFRMGHHGESPVTPIWSPNGLYFFVIPGSLSLRAKCKTAGGGTRTRQAWLALNKSLKYGL
jgi:hypothetical protein